MDIVIKSMIIVLKYVNILIYIKILFLNIN